MKKIFAIISAVLVLLMVACPAQAASGVSVTIPSFSVELNGETYQNRSARYPLLVYRDVTYFPMTYNLTRKLGLITGWDSAKGLYIVQHTEECTGKDAMDGKNRIGYRYKAEIPDYPIYVNGQRLVNKKEAYPVLNFRGVTYFPLSWRFAHDEFGWNISWDKKNGLRIDSTAVLTENTVKTDMKLKDISEEFSIEEGNLMYKQNPVLCGLTPELQENPKISAMACSGNSGSMLGVQLLYHSEIPAPYTPHRYYAFLEDKTGVYPVQNWNADDPCAVFFETKEAYYFGSYGREIDGTNHAVALSTVVKVEKGTRKETVLNPLYGKNASLQAIGILDDKLIVRACWFGTEEDLHRIDYGYTRVNPVKDGFYMIDSANRFHRIGEYLDGQAFLTNDGKLCVKNGQNKTVQVYEKKS